MLLFATSTPPTPSGHECVCVCAGARTRARAGTRACPQVGVCALARACVRTRAHTGPHGPTWAGMRAHEFVRARVRARTRASILGRVHTRTPTCGSVRTHVRTVGRAPKRAHTYERALTPSTPSPHPDPHNHVRKGLPFLLPPSCPRTMARTQQTEEILPKHARGMCNCTCSRSPKGAAPELMCGRAKRFEALCMRSWFPIFECSVVGRGGEWWREG